MADPILIPIIFVASIPIVALGYPIVRAFTRRLEQKPIGASVPPDVAHRLERMEQALDSIAIEVERISEGQRFTTKLLSERSESPATSTPPDTR